MKALATAFSFLLICSFDVAHASPIVFEVDYTTLFNEYCFFHSGVCVPRPNDPFTRTFTLERAQLMVDGVYDVAASLDPSPIVTPPPDATFTISLAAYAIVVDGQVIDMVMDFLETTEQSCLGFPLRTSNSFQASSGRWSRATTRTSIVSDICSGNSTAALGTYTVQQLPVAVPEPASLLLVLGGGLLAGLRKRHRVPASAMFGHPTR